MPLSLKICQFYRLGHKICPLGNHAPETPKNCKRQQPNQSMHFFAIFINNFFAHLATVK